jgi:SAM-dependent methyltransferase
MQAQWFESWFDSPWYPILYRHRDYAEAEAFIEYLMRVLYPKPGSRFLDLACGRGRHSIFIHKHGYDVTGLDLSAASIADAQLSAAPGRRFAVHDMRDPISGQYDNVLNLFTSFGYFQDKQENARVLQNIAQCLVPRGAVVIDFFNVHDVLSKLVPYEEINREGVQFQIHRRFEDGFIVKTIHLTDNGVSHDFQERVQGLELDDFETMLDAADLEIETLWGDYAGSSYVRSSSPRLIIFARHKTKSEEHPE